MRPVRLVRTCLWLAPLWLAGCQPQPDPSAADRPVLEPVTGVVTLDGKPLAGAVVTFLNQDEHGTLTVGETDENGAYRLKYLGAEGTTAGPYRVAVSYLMSADGEVIGLARRSTNSPTAEVNSATELLPPRYSDLGRSTMKAEVPLGGGSFSFELEGPLLDPPPTAKPDEAGEREGEPEPAAVKPKP